MTIRAGAASSATMPAMSRATRATMISMPETRATVAITTRRDEPNMSRRRGDPCGRPFADHSQTRPSAGMGDHKGRPYIILTSAHNPLRPRHDVATRLAGAVRLIVEKARIGLRHRIGAIVVHLRGLFVQRFITARTEPPKPVDFARPPLPFDH